MDLDALILQNCTFEKLPTNIRQALGNSKKEWEKAVVDYSKSHQLRWKANLVRSIVTDERKYYQMVIEFSKANLMLFPYHLAEVIVKGLHITPFNYYLDILVDMLKTDKSYDSLPNFSAVDGLLLLGIGRNEYIDLMNQCRSKGRIFRKRPNPRDLLPFQPVGTPNVQFWWDVVVGYVTEDDITSCTDEEHSVIDRLIDRGPTLCGVIDKRIIERLFVRGMVFFNVPITDDDCIVVPPLEGFVMNRVSGDFFERLLYKVFVSIDEHTRILDLATTLNVDLQLVKDAVSLYCRLGFAYKKGFESVPKGGDWHSSWRVEPPSRVLRGVQSTTTDQDLSLIDLTGTAASVPGQRGKRIGFLFDSTLTAFIMMGNLSMNLKKHAVTMFEVGKLSDESLDSFLQELGGITGQAQSEGDAARYFDHAEILRLTIDFLRKNPKFDLGDGNIDGNGLGLDLLRCESLNALDPLTCSRVLEKNYVLLVSMAPLHPDVRSVVSCSPWHVGPAIPEMNTPWMTLWLYTTLQAGPPLVLFAAGQRVAHTPSIFTDCDTVMITPWGREPQEVSVNTLLVVLNDSLMYGPVLVTAHSLRRGSVIIEHVPFPLPQPPTPSAPPVAAHNANADLVDLLGDLLPPSTTSTSSSTPAINKADAEYLNKFTIWNQLHQHESVKNLAKFVDLQGSVGYISMIKVTAATGDLAQFSNDWVVSNVNFGIPLFDGNLNKACRDAIIQRNLFSDEHMRRFSLSCRRLSLELLNFIDETLEHRLVFVAGSSTQSPFPSKTLSFSNGRLAEYDPATEADQVFYTS